jgi:hypothetical protein
MEIHQKLSRQERRELQRQEIKNGSRALGQKSRMNKIFFWTVALLVVGLIVYGLVVASIRSTNDDANRPGQAVPIQGREHIAVGASHAAYNSNPPTSGPHYEQDASWGVYQTELPDEQLIHNLEHGGIWISYNGIDDKTKTDLEKIAQSDPKIIVEPRSQDDAPIVLASWGRLQKLQVYDEKTILDFIKGNIGKAPEPLAQ